MNPYYPIFLNLDGRKCVVAGGGPVALRKVAALLERHADVTVISPRLCAGLGKLACDGKIRIIHRHYRAGDLKGAFIAVVATSNQAINLKAAEEAKNKKILVNGADNPRQSDFIVPSIVSRGSFAIAISTGGKSPALAKKIRTRLEIEFGTEYAALALLIEEVRHEIKKRRIKVSSHTWQEAIDLDSMIEMIKQGQPEKARDNLLQKLQRRHS